MFFEEANNIAETIRGELQPFCEPDRCIIAGSLRRQVPEVKDIELVCMPLKFISEDKNLFGDVVKKQIVIHPEFERIVLKTGHVIKGKISGRYMQIQMHVGITLDLFMPAPNDFFRQLAIRTGSADYTRHHIAAAWNKKGWCGVNGDLRLIRECVKTGPKTWQLRSTVTHPTLPPVWQSEEEFFSWLGKIYLEPKHRSL